MKRLLRRYEFIILVLFLLLLASYLLIAYFYHAPRGYYGSTELPRFADPWIARSETVLNGGLLYRDVFTATPPLTNLLIIPPSLVPIIYGNVNPWATLSFMVFFSLFNLFTAYILLAMGSGKAAGFWAAVIFLLGTVGGIASWIPYFGSGCYFTDRYSARSYIMPCSGYGGSNAETKRAYDEARQVAPFMLGDYYPLTPYSLANDAWIGWQFDRPEEGDGMIQVFRRAGNAQHQI